MLDPVFAFYPFLLLLLHLHHYIYYLGRVIRQAQKQESDSSIVQLTLYIIVLLFVGDLKQTMSSRRQGRQQSSSSSYTSRISDDQIINLVTRLRQVLPEIQERRRSNKVLINSPLSLAESGQTNIVLYIHTTF